MVRGHVDKDTGEAVLGELVTSYFRDTTRRDGKQRRESSAVTYKSQIERHYAGWVSMTLKKVNAITPDVVLDNFQQISVSGPMAARNSSLMLSALLNYGLAKYPGTLISNPLAILTSRHVSVVRKIQARHDCLSYYADKKHNDFKTFFDSIQVIVEVRRDLLLFILYSGMRKTEASTLEWQHIDIEHKELHILDTKNRLDLHIPLSRQAMVIIERRKSRTPEGIHFTFPSTVKSKTGYASARSTEIGQNIPVYGHSPP